MARVVDNTDGRQFDSAPLFLDVETTTYNKGHPFDPRNRLVSFAALENALHFKYHKDLDFRSTLHKLFANASHYCNFNCKFDLLWCMKYGVDINHLKVWDCQLAEFVYTGQTTPLISLNECLIKYSLPTKKDIVKEFWNNGVQTDDIPEPILKEYNEWDVLTTQMLYEVQQQLLTEEQKKLVWLLGEDLKVLAHTEFDGIKWDEEHAQKALEQHQEEVAGVKDRLLEYVPDTCRHLFNFNSGDHLSALLYGGIIEFSYPVQLQGTFKTGSKKGQERIYNQWHTLQVPFPQLFKPLANTEVKKTKGKDVRTRFYQTDEPTILKLNAKTKRSKEFLACLQAFAQKNKVVEMFAAIRKQFEEKGWTDNLIHSQYNQNIVATGRLSSSGPNMQNQPPEIDEFLVSRYD